MPFALVIIKSFRIINIDFRNGAVALYIELYNATAFLRCREFLEFPVKCPVRCTLFIRIMPDDTKRIIIVIC